MKKILRRSLFTILALILLAVIFYTEENARGKHAWNKAKQRFEARGASMDWSKYIPPAVPDDQNFFKAPKMTEWFVKGSTFTNDLVRRMTNLKTTGAVGSASNAITSELLAKNYVAWSDQYQPDFDLIREALKRPYARIDCDYSVPFAIQIPNFIAVRVVAQTLAQRAHCHLILKQPQAALEDLTLLHDMRHLLEGAPTHQPMTLVAAMINVAVSGLYAEAVSDGTKWHSWNEQQLAELQKQISDVNLTPYVYDALRTEPVSTCEVLRSITFISFLSEMGNSHIDLSSKIIDRSIPRGWMYQNMANIAMLNEKTMAGYDLEHDTISPRKFDDA
ncbi:MAG TPA: hypothetical protein VN516_04715, partial [Candidatus Baltobacteraceae bacterium]|nr:hypothetical protein [Candidatus Baltobacteraceae bacterium]